MPLPDLIEIVPLDKPVRAEITVPGSKSITNRALVLAALADGVTTLHGALWSEDTQVMVKALRKLGFKVIVHPDQIELCNVTIVVTGEGGRIPKKGGTTKRPLKLSVSNAGTAARFLAAFVCLGKGVYRLEGVARMHERPQAGLFNALRKPKLHETILRVFLPSSMQMLGYRVISTNGKLPMDIHGDGPKPGKCTVSIEESSQFASALMLCSSAGGWKIDVAGENAEESPYVAMTLNLIKAFPKHGGVFRIEPDASSGSYFWGAGWLSPISGALLDKPKSPAPWRGELACVANAHGNKESLKEQPSLSVIVRSWPNSRWQIDEEFPKFLQTPEHLPKTISRAAELGDSIMTAICIAPFADETCVFTDLGRLRLQETERVKALHDQLQKCGARVVEEGDTLTVYPSKLHGATIETYNDHRMAMCFAILGLKVPGIKIQNPACVKKTFPNFFLKLATEPPRGLGAEIRDGYTGRRLSVDELFAE